jgi:polyisoprenoid-binding protein YceI
MPWQVDGSHTYVEFGVRHLGISTVRGYFADVEGTLEMVDGLPQEVEARMRTAGINARDERRTQHLQNPDFFNVERFPEVVFRSRATERTGPGRCRLSGDLTILGVTRPIELDVEVSQEIVDPWGLRRVGFAATGRLDRRDFGMNWGPPGPNAVVDSQVDIRIDAEATHPAG